MTIAKLLSIKVATKRLVKLGESIKCDRITDHEIVEILKTMRHIGQHTTHGAYTFVGSHTELCIEYLIDGNYRELLEELNKLYIRILIESVKW